MPVFKYSFAAYDPVVHVRASSREADASPKGMRELCRAVMGLRVSKAREIVEHVRDLKAAVAFRRYKGKVGHKRVVGFHSGRYPFKAASVLLETIDNLEANAEFKGLDTEKLVLVHATSHAGRKVRGHMPRAFGRTSPKNNTLIHIELVAAEA